MLKHITNDVWKVVRSNYFLAVTQFGDSLSDALCLLRSEFQTQFLKVLCNIGSSAVLAESILSFSSKALRDECIDIKIAFVITVCMHSSHLSEDILAYHRLVGSNGYTAVSLNKFRDIVQLFLVDVCLCEELVFKNHLHTAKRGIATTFSKTIHRHMESLTTTKNSSERVAHSKVIVVVCMEVKMNIWVALYHLAHELYYVQRVQNAKSIWQHETPYASISK